MSEPGNGPQIALTVNFTYPPRDLNNARMLEAKRVAEMVNGLPTLIADESLPALARQACVDTYYTSVRALIEFLRVRPTKWDTDFSAKSIVTEWNPSLDNATEQRLLDCWEDASKHAVHFSDLRASHWVETTPEKLQSITDDVLAVWDQYADAANHLFAPKRADFRPPELYP